jgi:hypothetical protein
LMAAVVLRRRRWSLLRAGGRLAAAGGALLPCLVAARAGRRRAAARGAAPGRPSAPRALAEGSSFRKSRERTGVWGRVVGRGTRASSQVQRATKQDKNAGTEERRCVVEGRGASPGRVRRGSGADGDAAVRCRCPPPAPLTLDAD